jgi:MOSC domain-containing protein YiiM
MTAREIAALLNKTERSIRNWIAKAAEKNAAVAEKNAAAGHGKAADYSQDETLAIIEAGLGKNAAAVYRANAHVEAQPPAVPAVNAEMIAAIVRETIKAMVPVMVEAIKNTMPPPAAALPAPAELSERDQLRRVVNNHARRSGDHAGAWRELYTQFYYRYHRNIRESAKNRGLDTLDYAENEGIMGDLLALAESLFGRAA